MPGFLVLPFPHLNDLHVPLPAHTKHIQQQQRFLFHIYVGFPYLLMVNRRFIGDEARGQRFTQGEFHSCGHLGSKCPRHLYTRPCDSSTDNCFQQELHLVLQKLHLGLSQETLNLLYRTPKYSHHRCSCSTSPVQTNKNRSSKSDHHILIQQWRLSRTLYLNETTASHKQCETSALRQPFGSTKILQALTDRNITWQEHLDSTKLMDEKAEHSEN